MQIPEEKHVDLFHAALADAGLSEDETVLFRIAGHPGDDAEVVYAPPPGLSRLNYQALIDVGSTRLHEYAGIHRFVAYAEIERAPDGAVATELRHEIEHALQFKAYGPSFTELDQIARSLARDANVAYETIPSECAANQAALDFAKANFPTDLEAMTGDERFRQYTADPRPVADLLAATEAFIWQLARRDQIDPHTGRDLGAVVDELIEGARGWARDVTAGVIGPVTRSDSQPRLVVIDPHEEDAEEAT